MNHQPSKSITHIGPLFLWISIVWMGHLPWIGAPFVNQEYVFAEGARFLADPTYKDGIMRYIAMQANPLGFSATASVLLSIEPTGHYWLFRIPSLLGAGLILLAGAMLLPDSKSFHVWSACTLLNPLIWVYSGSATADVLPTGLVSVTIAVALRADGRVWMHMMASLIFAASCLVKYNCALMGLGLLATLYHDSSWNGRRGSLGTVVASYVLFPSFFLIAYLVVTHYILRFFIFHDRFHGVFTLSNFGAQWFVILCLYLSFFSQMLGVPILASLRAELSQVSLCGLLALGVPTAVLGAFIFSRFGTSIGEMNYGIADRVLTPLGSSVLLTTGLLASVAMLAGICRSLRHSNDRLSLVLVSVLAPYLLTSSIFRPTQRYLILLIPLTLVHIFRRYPAEILLLVRQGIIPFAVVCYILVGWTGMSFLSAQGEAAQRMADWIRDHDLIARVDPGVLIHHAGQCFPVEQKETYQYIVVTEPVLNALHQEEIVLFRSVIFRFSLVSIERNDHPPRR